MVLRKKLLDAGETEAQVKDLLRAAFAWTVAALDAYIHDKISEQMVPHIKLLITLPEGTDGEKKKKSELIQPLIKFLDEQRREDKLTHLSYWEFAQKPRPFVQIRARIDQFLLLDSFQEPGKIQNALEIIACRSVFDTIYGKDTPLRKAVWKNLDEYSRRRNKIVHEGDLMRSRKGSKNPRAISQAYVNKAINDVEQFVDKLDPHIDEELKALEALKPKKKRGRPAVKPRGRPKKIAKPAPKK